MGSFANEVKPSLAERVVFFHALILYRVLLWENQISECNFPVDEPKFCPQKLQAVPTQKICGKGDIVGRDKRQAQGSNTRKTHRKTLSKQVH